MTSEEARMRMREWGWSWLALTAALAIHVADEAVHDFLSVYNPNAAAIRTRLPWLPIPTFTFRSWLIALGIAVVILAALSTFAFRARLGFRFFAYFYAAVMILNGLGHSVGSIVLHRLMPGVLSLPLLIVCAAVLLYTTRRVARMSS